MAESSGFDEPRRHPRVMIALVLVILGTAPLPFVGSEVVLVAGLPLWLWWSLGLTVLMSAITSWALMRLWRDDDLPEDAEEAGP